MKYLSSVLLLLISFGLLPAQKTKTQETSPVVTTDPARIHKDVYHRALATGDINTAVTAVQYIVASGPECRNWRDTLAILFFQRGSYESAVLQTRELLAENPQSQAMLEISAVSKQSLGLAKEALDDYEKLYGLSKSWYHLYEIGSLQLALKRHGECGLTAQRIAESPEAAELEIAIRIQQGEQSVPLNAAAWNMLGVVMTETGKMEEAKAFYKKALEIKSDFALAKFNLEETIKAGENK